MADLLSRLSSLGASSFVPFAGYSAEDARLAAEDPAKSFAALLRPEPGEGAAPGVKAQKPLIDRTDKLYEQCEALETFLVKTLLSSMRNTVRKSGLVDEGFAGKMYEDMLYDEYAKDYTKNAGFGLADQVYLEVTGQRGKAVSRYA
jgi:flagellar protein FlgJ